MPYEFDSGRPIYNQLAEWITQAIVSGEYPPGQRLAGVRDMALEYGVNPNTVQRTMSELERQGLVIAQRTAGRYVTEDRELIARIRRTAALERTAQFLQQMQKLGMTPDEIRELLTEAAQTKGETT